MMIITAAHADLLEEVISEFYILDSLHYNLLLAYPAITEHADPEPSSLLVDNFGGEFVWDRFGLLRDQGSDNSDTRRQDTGCEMHCCGLCKFSSDSFDDFATHLDSPQHAVKSYLAKVEAKRLEFVKRSHDSDDDVAPETHKASY
ncbi:unnamed protein product [Eruca vesicaria subsp. sativa]|uniref:Uncharacterized protein n=1 Tax=Eruca vesicaria subsp. sativa TaxID=29727 RepID=A0ABC8INP7_ERUVS|nr:unnamed protein product [Eruca vesicaria subsp. sativa]